MIVTAYSMHPEFVHPSKFQTGLTNPLHILYQANNLIPNLVSVVFGKYIWHIFEEFPYNVHDVQIMHEDRTGKKILVKGWTNPPKYRYSLEANNKVLAIGEFNDKDISSSAF